MAFLEIFYKKMRMHYKDVGYIIIAQLLEFKIRIFDLFMAFLFI
jgi:hypothetical protein